MAALEGDELDSWRRMANSSLLTTLLSNSVSKLIDL